MAIENIFRFISLRPTKLEKEKGRLNMHVYTQDYKSPFYDSVKKAIAAGGTKDILSRIAIEYQSTPNYVKEIQSIKFPIVEMLNWIILNGRTTFQKSNFIASFEEIAGKDLKDILVNNDFKVAYSSLCDSVLADILSSTPVNEKEEKISAIKILFTLKSVGEKTLALIETELVDDYFGRSTFVIPLLKPAPRQEQPKPPKPDTGADDREKEKNKLKEYLLNFQ